MLYEETIVRKQVREQDVTSGKQLLHSPRSPCLSS